jgi:intron-binding protein aquarius
MLQSGEDHATEQYSKVGRVNWSLSRRQELLSQVQNLASSLSVAGDVGYSCETASYFQMEHIQPRIRKFQLDLEATKGSGEDMQSVGVIEQIFPFRKYFSSVEFPGDIQQDETVANQLFECIQNLFQELVDYR